MSTTTPGYILPTSTAPLPRGLNLNQFLQTVLVGISGVSGLLVRPSWQVDPPKNPDIDVDWIAFGVTVTNPDANAYVGVSGETTVTQRHEALEVACSFYGPDAMGLAGIVRDGFQIEQNRHALRAANMGFVSTGPVMLVPELINERFVNRTQMSVFLRREIQRTYGVPTLISATGIIHTVTGGEEYLLAWET